MEAITTIVWDMDEDAAGNVQHIAQHGISQDEVDEILTNPWGEDVSRSSGLPGRFGEVGGRFIKVYFEWVDVGCVYPVTAFEPSDE